MAPGLAAALATLAESVSSTAALRRWWRPPVLAALGALVAVYLFGLLVADLTILLAPAGGNSGRDPVNDLSVWRVGAGLAYVFQGVTATLSGVGIDLATVSITVVPMGGLLAVGAVLAVGAGLVASRETSGTQRALAVLRFAVLYALASLIASFLVGLYSGQTHLRVSHIGALLLPLLWALIFGFVGMARAGYGRGWWRRTGAWLDRRVSGAAAAADGAAAGARAGLALGLIAVLVYLLYEAWQIQPGTNLRALTLTMLWILLLAPNLVAFALLGGMGTTVGLTGTAFGIEASRSVGIFGAAGAGNQGVQVPAYWLVLILVPLGAMICAGYTAARAAANQRLAIRAALLAGGLLVIGCWLLAWTSGAHVSAGAAGGSGAAGASAAMSMAAAMLLPLAWAPVGTLVGALGRFAATQRRNTGRPPGKPPVGTAATGREGGTR